ncbi:heat repeat-containing protein [Cystoisospora suis]|uniref:Heat repeat-containing protein n=1 Tax=Cystoisospora suis TaxID=483139 RepID=A0A2C6KI27_9APIC|nr:heat repeat-containing protein [Cystoisospora suis]
MLGDETTPLPVRQTCELAVEALYRKTEKKKKKKDSENQIDSRHLSSIGGEEEKKEESKQQKSGKGVIDSLGPSSGTKEAKSREANTSSVRSEEYEWFRYEEDNEYRDAQFNTVDPSEPYPDCASRDVPWLAEQLMNPNEKLWNRYRSLFTLRNLNSPESITAIATALEKDTSSALLRHEIAFVLGQLRPCEAVCDLALQRDVKETEEEKRKLSPHTSPDSPSPSSSHSLADAETTAAASPVSQMSERACADTNKERGSEKDTVRGGLGGKEDENERKEVISKIIGVHTPEGAANVAANALITCLTNEREHSMARHEAALALGSLGASPEAGDIKWMNSDQTIRSLVIDTLQKYRYDTDRVVSESCLVGLDSMQDELGISLGV